MPAKLYKYCLPFLLYGGAILSFFSSGLVVFLPLLYAWILVPLLELLIRPDHSNLTAAEEELAKNDRLYDVFLYLVVPFQYAALACFLYTVTFVAQPWTDLAGKAAVMGLLCGTFGINVGHELGHRSRPAEQALARLLLLTSLYMHFFIEHNKGHHKRVATPQDPSSARYGETVYRFYFRSIIYGYLSAWEIAAADCCKKDFPVISWRNEMLRFQVVQFLFLLLLVLFLGWTTAGLFMIAALNGILLLETVNYIEHYGLQRRLGADGKFGRALPQHSWNSNHVIGRIMLFELSRHSDHHYLASRKYQLLRHHEGAPQMPTGYPGMMLLALLPPLWFRVMNRRVNMVHA